MDEVLEQTAYHLEKALAHLYKTIDVLQKMNVEGSPLRSRELSNAITYLQTGELWAVAALGLVNAT